MALVVESGTGSASSEAYASAATCLAYASARGLSFADNAAGEAALRRATAWLDATYGGRFPGYRLTGRTQALEWPRSAAADVMGYAIASSEIPREIIAASCEAAIREYAEPGALAPDLERGGQIQSMQAGSVSMTYASGAPAETTRTAIDNILATLIGRTPVHSGRVSRG